MDVKRQQGSGDQLYLFVGLAPLRPGAGGKGGTRTAAFEALQASAAFDQQRALTTDLMERVCDRENLNRALPGETTATPRQLGQECGGPCE